MKELKRYWTPGQAAKKIGVTTKCLRDRCVKYNIKPRIRNGLKLFTTEEIELLRVRTYKNMKTIDFQFIVCQ